MQSRREYGCVGCDHVLVRLPRGVGGIIRVRPTRFTVSRFLSWDAAPRGLATQPASCARAFLAIVACGRSEKCGLGDVFSGSLDFTS